MYKILCVAVESTNHNPREKEKVGALFRDLFRTFFHMPVHYMYDASSVTTTAAAEVGATVSAREAWEIGSKVRGKIYFLTVSIDVPRRTCVN